MVNPRSIAALLVLVTLAAALLLGGCFGGNVAVIDTGRPMPPYTPNYIGSISTARWPNAPGDPITFRVTGGGSDIPGIDMERTVRLAAQAWNKPLTGLAAVQSVNGPADIEYTFVPAHALDNAYGRVYGTTTLTYADDAQTIIKSASVQLDRSLLPYDLAACAAHETGHALGIKGHSPFNGDLMFGQKSELPLVVHLTQRDADTIAYIYAAPTGN